MRRFFTDFQYTQGVETLTIGGDEAKHILKVLRFKVGDKLIVSNYEACSFESEIVEADNKSCVIKFLNPVDISNEINVDITIFQGYPKSDKLELIVQKLTEIGVKKIIPILTNRVDVKLNADKFRIDRLNKIAKEACKQCGSSKIPKIEFPIKLNEITDLSNYDLIIVAYENEKFNLKKLLKDAAEFENIKNICVFIGPEGGFEEHEVLYIENLGGKSVSLGQRILRTETAAIFISSILQYEFGDR